MGLLLFLGKEVHAEYPRLVNLDLSQVEFVMSPIGDDKETYNQLSAHAVKTLTQAGLHLHSDYSPSTSDLRPNLRVSLQIFDLSDTGAIPHLGKTCPGKWLYMQKIELWEYVFTKRNPDYPVWTVTWGRAIPLPIVDGKPTIESLENALDRYLGEFIADYKQANRPKNK